MIAYLNIHSHPEKVKGRFYTLVMFYTFFTCRLCSVLVFISPHGGVSIHPTSVPFTFRVKENLEPIQSITGLTKTKTTIQTHVYGQLRVAS